MSLLLPCRCYLLFVVANNVAANNVAAITYVAAKGVVANIVVVITSVVAINVAAIALFHFFYILYYIHIINNVFIYYIVSKL